MKVTSGICKDEIVKWCSTNQSFICAEFYPVLPVSEYKKTLIKNNWKRSYKRKDGNSIERCFDCKPFDDQLRAYVIEENGIIVSVHVQGE